MQTATARTMPPPLPDLLLPRSDTAASARAMTIAATGPSPDHGATTAAVDSSHHGEPITPVKPMPLPLPIPTEPLPPAPLPIHSVRGGCWLMSYQPAGAALVAFDGTLRVETHSAGRTASGDLYQRPLLYLPMPGFPFGKAPLQPIPSPVPTPFPTPVPSPFALLGPAPDPALGIPVLQRSRYRYYVRVTALPEMFYFGGSFSLGFELWRFTAPNSWALESTLSAQMTRMVGPSGYPSASDYAEGDVKNAAGSVVGRLTMGWLSAYFRKCTVEIDTVAGSERPTQSGAGHTWRTVMDSVGWDVNVQLSDTNVAEASGNSWSDAEMHAAMLARRAATNLDAEWHYHVLAVKNIDSTPRGIMYDTGGTDSNNVPREGIGIASHWIVDPGWGTVSGQRFGTASAPYFRTAVHEIGHAMGLYHNFADHGFMCTSDVIAAAGTPASPFPANIQWSYQADNLKQLRHYPDPFVRPGSVAFGSASVTTPTITPTDLEVEVDELELKVAPLLNEVPLGAPVRIGVTLTNRGDRTLRVPADLSLKGEFVAGQVIDPTGAPRSFRTVIRCAEDHPFRDLAPGKSLSDAMTLLRGAEGALFGVAGVHEVQVEVHWEIDRGMTAHVAGAASVMVTGPVDARHAAAAHQVLATPDAHLVLAIGGDHLTDGIAAIHAALRSPVLRPHFAAIEAKRLGQRFGGRKADLSKATELIDADVVMSGAEVGKLAAIARAGEVGGGRDSALARTLKARSHGLTLSEKAQQAIDRL